MQFSKSPLSITDQVQLLESRGMLVPNKNYAEQVLSNISYYRLRAYMMSFQNPVDPNHAFTAGTTFNEVIDLYSFDRELRLLVFDATERIEIALRTQIIYQFSLQHGAWWFEDPSLYINNYIYSKNLAKLDEELDRSQEVFIGHYKNKYTSPQRPPAWMSLEVTSMGLLSKLYRELKLSPAKKAVSKHFDLGHPKVLESWMQSFSYVRNICAHHSRLFNRVLTVKPTYPTHTTNPWLRDTNFHHAKVYGLLSCAVYLLKTIQPDTTIPTRLKNLLIQYPQIKPHQLGMSADWENEQLWK